MCLALSSLFDKTFYLFFGFNGIFTQINRLILKSLDVGKNFFILLLYLLYFFIEFVGSAVKILSALNTACYRFVICFDILMQSNDFKVQAVLNSR